MPLTNVKATRGRPRAFDEVIILDRAIELFSAAGFSGVSISDLTRATGLTVGSLYKAYQDKSGIFSKALERYIELREAQITASFVHADNARDRIAFLLKHYVDLSEGQHGKRGCMVVAGLTDLDQVGPHVAVILRAHLVRRKAILSQLIAEGQRDGSICKDVEPQVLAEILHALLYGMRLVGKGGTLSDNVDVFIMQALKILD